MTTITVADLEQSVKDTEEFIASIVKNKYCYKDEQTYDDVINRVIKETFKRIDPIWKEKIPQEKFDDITKMLKEKYFIPGGSILAGLKDDPDSKSSLSNCYVLAIEEDSISGIVNCIRDACITYSYRGGVGIDITILRPNGTKVSNAANTSSGAVSFIPMIAQANATIGSCLAGDSKVIVRDVGVVDIDTVDVGDLVWTRVGWVEVTNVYQNTKQLYKLTTENGYTIRCSEDHVLLSSTDEDGDHVDVYEKPLRDFELGDSVMLVTGTTDDNITDLHELSHSAFRPYKSRRKIYSVVDVPKVLDEKLAYLLGYIWGNGHVNKTNTHISCNVACPHDRPEIEQKIKDYTFQLTGKTATVCKGDGAVNKLGIFQAEICAMLRENGLLKRASVALDVPKLIWTSPVSVRMAFLSGLFDADGYNGGSKSGYVFCSVCGEFQMEIQRLLASVGIISNLHIDDRSHISRWRDLYRVCVTGQYSQKLFVSLMTESLKVNRSPYVAVRDNNYSPYTFQSRGILRKELKTPDRHKSPMMLHEDINANPEDVAWLVMDYVKWIETDSVEITYDLQLADEHLFWCNGLYVHNSGRRGAMMISMDIRHPDIMKFIWCKADPHSAFVIDKQSKDVTAKLLNNYIKDHNLPEQVSTDLLKIVNKGRVPEINTANISVKITDDFMHLVRDESDEPWICIFPDIEADKELYNTKWTGDYAKWLEDGGTLKEYTHTEMFITDDNSSRFIGRKILNERNENIVIDESWISENITDINPIVAVMMEYPTPSEIYTELAAAAHMRGDPGVMFWDEHVKYTTTTHIHEDLKPLTTNPCFSKDTLVAVADKRMEVDFPTLAEEGKDVPVFTKDKITGRLIIEMGRNPRAVNVVTKLVKVHFSDGSFQKVTYDHRFDLIDGSVVPASELREGERVYSIHENDIDSAFVQWARVEESQEITTLPTVKYFNPVSSESIIKVKRMCKQCGDEFIVKLAHRQVEYCCQECGQASKACVDALRENELSKNRYSTITYKDMLNSSEGLAVTKIEHIHYNDWVYTITVDNTHTLFTRVNSDTHYSKNYVLSRNCGELPLDKGNSCILGAHVLSKYVKDPWSTNASFDTDKFFYHCELAVIFMSMVSNVNESLHPLKVQREVNHKTKRIGIEFTAFADMLSMLNYKYGEESSIEFVKKIMRNKTYLEFEISCNLAKLLGPCEYCDPEKNIEGLEKLIASDYYKDINNYFISDKLSNNILKYGLYNIAFNTVGPTGTISIVADNCSSGIEPILALFQKRNTRVGDKSTYYLGHLPLVRHLLKIYENTSEVVEDIDTIKERFSIIEATDVDPVQRIEMQKAVQLSCDGSISSTINLNKDATVDNVKDILHVAWDRHLKGITIYRDGSLDGVISKVANDKSPTSVVKYKVQTSSMCIDDIPRSIRKLPTIINAVRYEEYWNGVSIYIIVSVDENDDPVEIFISSLPREVSMVDGIFNEKDYQDKLSLWMAITRIVSVGLRGGIDVSEYIKQLEKSTLSVNDLMAVVTRVLRRHVKDSITVEELGQLEIADMVEDSRFSDCPVCGMRTFARVSGCNQCYNKDCGHSTCM